MKTLLAAAAITAALSLPAPSDAAGYVGYVVGTHAGAGCFMALIGPIKNSPADAVWFSINTSTAGVAASNPVQIQSRISELQMSELAGGILTGVDYSTPTVLCELSAEDGFIATYPITIVNTPPSLNQ